MNTLRVLWHLGYRSYRGQIRVILWQLLHVKDLVNEIMKYIPINMKVSNLYINNKNLIKIIDVIHNKKKTIISYTLFNTNLAYELNESDRPIELFKDPRQIKKMNFLSNKEITLYIHYSNELLNFIGDNYQKEPIPKIDNQKLCKSCHRNISSVFDTCSECMDRYYDWDIE